MNIPKIYFTLIFLLDSRFIFHWFPFTIGIFFFRGYPIKLNVNRAQ
jgi:hypothetical protein